MTIPTAENHEPSNGFSFPKNMSDTVGDSLRDATDAALRNALESEAIERVRAARNKPTVRIVNDEPVVQVAPPPVTPMASAEAVSVDLPSRFHYYKFKDLYARPIRLPQMAKLSKANETGDLQTQVEAISSLLSTPSGETDLALKLTMADYTAVLYWLRMASFTKPQMRVTSTCTNAEHRAKVTAGTLPDTSLRIETVVLKSDMRTAYLDEVPDPAHYSIEVDGITIPFGPETLGDTIQFLAHPDWVDEEFQYKSRIAAVLKLEEATGKPWTWTQRVQFVEEFMTPDMALKALHFAELMDGYGVVETVQTKCQGCGSVGVTTISIDPLTFLSPQF